MILKLVNLSANAVTAKVDLSSVAKVRPDATRITLSGDPGAVNAFDKPELVTPRVEPFQASDSFTCELPASSFTLIRVKTN